MFKHVERKDDLTVAERDCVIGWPLIHEAFGAPANS
jgi:hypothetical protein